MSFIEHLEELRRVLIRCFCAIILCAIPCGIFWRKIFDFIAVRPLRLSDPAPTLIFTAPAEAIFFIFKLALACGLVLASPFIFFQIWRFIAPALYKKEKAVIIPIVIASTFCFLAGIMFCYFLLPLFLKFLIGFAGGQIDPFFRISEYFGFVIRMCIAFGFAFELPVVAFALSKMGVIDHRFLIKYFRHAIVLIFIAAAIITPTPDALSQSLLALPLIALYGLSIFIAYLVSSKSARPLSSAEEDAVPKETGAAGEAQ
ncbi:MAG: twin-arginine translocase subunit TatC [Spirochaetes bacterium]|nr:twin-arginine translocase subunit TatC [Spirochaetota bacterium]